MRNIKLLLGMGIGALFLSGLPAVAEVTTSIKNKTAEITINVDDSLKAYPKLFENLAAEGKVWAMKADAEAEVELKELPKRPVSTSPWSYERSYNLRSAVGPYIGVLRQDYTNTGGAHPNRYTDTILWDRDAGKRISIRPLFNETEDGGPTMTALAKLVRAALAQEKKRRDAPVASDPAKDEWLRSVKPWLLKLGPISLAPSTERDKSSGLSFHFSPYMVGPYVEGDYVVFVPWTDLKPYLSAQGTALFGGTRPASDKDQQP
ncbi:MAG: DUF3298 domain-containing protein [Xanthobacteraceae bacterium]|nr:DUF3298 domain-containing protein [Xanthobacteraceae bacterium]